MREAPPPHSIMLIYRNPLSSIAYRLQPINKCIVRFYRCLDRNVIRLFEADGLQQFAPDVSHGLSGLEVLRCVVLCVDSMKDFGHAELGSNDACWAILLF